MQSLLAPLQESVTQYHLVGYAFAVIAPIYPLARISTLSFQVVLRDVGVQQLDINRHHRADLPLIVGVLERILYVAAWLTGHAEFIGFWMALKVAGGWVGWSETLKVPVTPGAEAKIEVNGRLLFNTHLIASGLSALNGVVGALIIERLILHDGAHAFWLAFVVALLTILIWLWFRHEGKHPRGAKHAA